MVELFLLGEDNQYLELEFGPHGHYLALYLIGPRNCVRTDMNLEFVAEIVGSRWRGSAKVPVHLLPPRLDRANGYAIRGVGPQRQYMAAEAVPGPQPDFHRLQYFRPIELTLCHRTCR